MQGAVLYSQDTLNALINKILSALEKSEKVSLAQFGTPRMMHFLNLNNYGILPSQDGFLYSSSFIKKELERLSQVYEEYSLSDFANELKVDKNVLSKFLANLILNYDLKFVKLRQDSIVFHRKRRYSY